MAVQEIPVPEALFALAAKPVILADSSPADKKHASCDGGDVAQQDVAEYVVPPALAEGWQNVLHRKLDNFVK